MKFTTEKNEIVDALQMGASIAERRQTIPILANLRIVARDGKVEITATDLEIQIKTLTEVKKVVEEGEITVSARKMSELCRSLPDNEALEFDLNNGKLTVSSKNFHADFATISALDFPELESKEETNSLSISSSALQRLLNKTAFCMASQDVRYYLNGLLVEYKGGEVNAVATDGHRLALATSPLDKTITIDGERQILPRKAVLELSKILRQENEDIKITFGNSSLSIQDENLDFSTKLIDGKFPDYEKVIPKNISNTFSINRKKFLESINRISTISSEKSKAIKLNLNKDKITISANNIEEGGSGIEEINVKYNGPSLDIGFNSGYLKEIINQLTLEEITILFSDSTAPTIIKDGSKDESLYVLMPMRV